MLRPRRQAEAASRPRWRGEGTVGDKVASFFSAWRAPMAGLALLVVVGILGPTPATSAQEPDPKQLFQEALEAQQRGDAELAANKYASLLQHYPDMLPARANLGVVLASLGRYDEAITQYHVALSEAPGDPKLRLDLGLAYYKKGDFAGGAAEFASLHKDDPTNLRITTLLGTCQAQLGFFGQAVALLAPLEKANPDNLDLEWALGLALIGSGDTRKGLERVQKVADQQPNVEAYQLAANFSLGLTLFDQARRDAEAVVRLNAYSPKAYVVLGMVDEYAGDDKGAEEQFQKALAIDPHDLQARVHLASVYYNARKLDDAREQLNRALAQDPHLSSALYMRGRLERAQGNLEAAVTDLESAERGDPHWLLPHIELTALYYMLKRPADGEREKTTVDQLRAQERQRRDDTRVILPQVPSQ